MITRISCGLILVFCMLAGPAFAQQPESSTLEANKELTRNFYRDLWLTNNTGQYAVYVADQYVVHDIGKRKNVTEPAIEQKNIADFFWKNGELSGSIDYQIAERDLVATRWHFKSKPTTWFGRLVIGPVDIPVINVFRIKDGKIVEIWNHRHDIDTGKTKVFYIQGLGAGLLIALVPAIYAFLLHRRLKRGTA